MRWLGGVCRLGTARYSTQKGKSCQAAQPEISKVKIPCEPLLNLDLVMIILLIKQKWVKSRLGLTSPPSPTLHYSVFCVCRGTQAMNKIPSPTLSAVVPMIMNKSPSPTLFGVVLKIMYKSPSPTLSINVSLVPMKFPIYCDIHLAPAPTLYTIQWNRKQIQVETMMPSPTWLVAPVFKCQLIVLYIY